jgi:hypothetical protein
VCNAQQTSACKRSSSSSSSSSTAMLLAYNILAIHQTCRLTIARGMESATNL